MSSHKLPQTWARLSKYSACDIADALLKLGVPGAGFLPDIGNKEGRAILDKSNHLTTSAPSPTFSPSDPDPVPQTKGTTKSPPSRIVRPCRTVIFTPKSTPSFPLTHSHQPTPSSSTPTSRFNPGTPIPPGVPYPDIVGSPDTITILSLSPSLPPLLSSSTTTCAFMGGILAHRLAHLSTTAVLVDGRIRDISTITSLPNFPVWSRGVSAVGAGGQFKATATDGDVVVGHVPVSAGDLVMLDREEGCAVAIPGDKVDDVIEMLPKMVEADEKAMEDVKRGVSVGEAFKRWRGKI